MVNTYTLSKFLLISENVSIIQFASLNAFTVGSFQHLFHPSKLPRL